MRAPMEIAYTSSLWRYRCTRFELQPKRLRCASRATTYTYKCGGTGRVVLLHRSAIHHSLSRCVTVA